MDFAVAVVLAAIALGFVIGRLLPRRKREIPAEFRPVPRRQYAKNVTLDAAEDVDRPRGRSSRSHITQRRTLKKSR